MKLLSKNVCLLVAALVVGTVARSNASIISVPISDPNEVLIGGTTIGWVINGSLTDITFSSTATVMISGDLVRRSSDLANGGPVVTNEVNVLLIGTIPLSGAVIGDDNWLLLSLEANELDIDTAIQFRILDSQITFLQAFHDDAPTGENVIAGVSDMNDIEAVPEPSAALLVSIGCGALLLRRSRKRTL